MTYARDEILNLDITVQQNRTVLARCLQICSRRGFTLVSLHTETHNQHEATLHCQLHGPANWHAPLPLLLARLIDVKNVEKLEVI